MSRAEKIEIAKLKQAQAELNRRRTKAILEISVEEYFVARVEALGGVAEKTRAIGSRGYFDRVAVIPRPQRRYWTETLNGDQRVLGRVPGRDGYLVEDDKSSAARIIFAELKRPVGGRLAEHQKQRRARYAALGAEAVVLKSKEDVDALLGPAV